MKFWDKNILWKERKLTSVVFSSITEEKGIQFYNSDRVSRQAPGKRNVKSVEEAGTSKGIVV